MIQPQENGKIRVEDYGLAEFMKQVQEQVRLGFEIDLETNEGYPQNFGSLYTCLMHPFAPKDTPDLPEVPPELLDQVPQEPEVPPELLDQVPQEPEVTTEPPAKIDGRSKAARNK